jgi:hypothetical protein
MEDEAELAQHRTKAPMNTAGNGATMLVPSGAIQRSREGFDLALSPTFVKAAETAIAGQNYAASAANC